MHRAAGRGFGWLRVALRHGANGGWIAGGRGSVPRVQLLAGRLLRGDGPPRRRRAVVREAGVALQRSWLTRRGVRCGASAAVRQLSAGVLARRAAEHRVQSLAPRRNGARGTAPPLTVSSLPPSLAPTSPPFPS